MSSDNIERALARIESKLDAFLTKAAEHEARIRRLEIVVGV